jgi:hypothetical protein
VIIFRLSNPQHWRNVAAEYDWKYGKKGGMEEYFGALG